LPGPLTPTIQEAVTRLADRLPFSQAVDELQMSWHVDVSPATVRRQAETAGAAYVALQTADVERLERDTPPSPLGPDLQQLSVDGAMVPLLHKQWGEMRTMAIGDVGKPVLKDGEMQVHTGHVSYFSRLCDAQTFTRLATVETHRRGTETAKAVCAVVDGATWEQDFIDTHRPDAVRILDFSHAAEYVSAVGHLVYGEETASFTQWFASARHELKHGEPETVIAGLQGLRDAMTEVSAAGDAARATMDTSITYLQKRTGQMRYAHFVAQGYPIGSGMVESAHTVVIEARLKGAGMHWAPTHANEMGALRAMLCSERWGDEWPRLCDRLRLQVREKQREARRQRLAAAAKSPDKETSSEPASQIAQPSTRRPDSRALAKQIVAEKKAVVQTRPAANHPWRHSPVGRARYQRAEQLTSQRT
jgi:hypothetical protein